MVITLTAAEFNAAYIAEQLSEAGVWDCRRGAAPVVSEAAVENAFKSSYIATLAIVSEQRSTFQVLLFRLSCLLKSACLTLAYCDVTKGTSTSHWFVTEPSARYRFHFLFLFFLLLPQIPEVPVKHQL